MKDSRTMMVIFTAVGAGDAARANTGSRGSWASVRLSVCMVSAGLLARNGKGGGGSR